MNATTRRQAIINYALLVFFCFIALFPIFGVFIASVYPSGSQPSSFKLPSHFAFHNFVTAWTQGDFSMYFRSSAIVAVSVVVLATGLSVLGGYAFGTMRFRGSKVLFYTFILGLIIPTEATIVSLYYDIRSLNLIDTWTALILVEVSGAVAFGVFWMRAAFLSAPRSLLEAARIDGAADHDPIRLAGDPHAHGPYVRRQLERVLPGARIDHEQPAPHCPGRPAGLLGEIRDEYAADRGGRGDRCPAGRDGVPAAAAAVHPWRTDRRGEGVGDGDRRVPEGDETLR
jgi:hypothetical protein